MKVRTKESLQDILMKREAQLSVARQALEKISEHVPEMGYGAATAKQALVEMKYG